MYQLTPSASVQIEIGPSLFTDSVGLKRKRKVFQEYVTVADGILQYDEVERFVI